MAHALRGLLLAAAALALGGAAWEWHQGRPQQAWVVAALLLTLHLGGLALEFALARLVRGPCEPVPPPRAADLLRAFLGEAWIANRSFFHHQAFRHALWPDRGPVPGAGARGVLLVHGFVCNRGVWNPWLERLSRNAVAFAAPSLVPILGDIDAYVAEIERGVRELERSTGCAPVLVGHSMGGLVIRAWWARHGRAGRVHHAITLGTPHRGTWIARFAFSRNGRQMQAGSPWLQGLAEAEAQMPRLPLTAFYSDCDNIVMPPSLAVLEWADNRPLPAQGHVQLIEHDAPWQELLARLRQP